jgi:hypothetical protein
MIFGPLLYHRDEKNLGKQKLHYFVLRPCQGDLLCIQKKETYDHIIKNENLPMNQLKGIEILDLNTSVMSVYQSFRPQFTEKEEYALELLSGESDIRFLAGYD